MVLFRGLSLEPVKIPPAEASSFSKGKPHNSAGRAGVGIMVERVFSQLFEVLRQEVGNAAHTGHPAR